MSENSPEAEDLAQAEVEQVEDDADDAAEYVEPQGGQDAEPTGRPEADKHPDD